MHFELTKEILDDIREYIASGNDSKLEAFLSDLHHADIEELIDELKLNEAIYLFKLLSEQKQADVLVELEDDVREKLLESMTSKEIADIVDDKIDSDDAADLVSFLSQEKKSEVISLLKDEELVSDIVDLLTYDEDTAGGIMAKELIKVSKNWTITTAFRQIRKQAMDIEEVYSVYVVDGDDKLIGTLSLRKLLLHSKDLSTRIEDIYSKEDLQTARVDEDVETIALRMQKYDLVVMPVIDERGVLVGRITIDDVVDIITEEAEKDYQMLSGLSEDVESTDKISVQLRGRLPWILIGMFGGVLSSQVIGQYQEQLQLIPAMALFIPLITATGGNVGVQSSAIVVQGLANNTMKLNNLKDKLFKELGVGAINGLICSLILFGYSFFSGQEYALAYTVSTALFIVIIFSSLFGTFFPLLLNYLKFDPAHATGPFITTSNDVLGLFIYFMVGHLMYTL
jgi:magnesium transporter